MSAGRILRALLEEISISYYFEKIFEGFGRIYYNAGNGCDT